MIIFKRLGTNLDPEKENEKTAKVAESARTMSDASGASDYDEDKALEAAMNVSVTHYHFMSASLNRAKDATATVLDSDPRDANRSVAQSVAASLADAEAVSSIMN